MEWIQMVLPSQELRSQIIEYLRDSQEAGMPCPWIDVQTAQEDFGGWLEDCQDKMLGLLGEQELLYFAVDSQNQVVGTMKIYPRRPELINGDKEDSFLHLRPGCDETQAKQQMLDYFAQ